jgi:hypothetical protein
MQWQDTKLHARMRTATLLQWQDTMLTNAHCCPAAVATATATATATAMQQQQQQQQQQSKMYTRRALQALEGKIEILG